MLPYLMFAVFAGAALLANVILRRSPLVRLNVQAGRTIFGGVVFALFVSAALLAAFFAIEPLVNAHVAWSVGDDYPFVLGFAAFLIVISFAFGWCWFRTKWVWDEQGIATFSGPMETRLAWDEISEVKVSPWTWKVSGHGRDIVWTRYTLGWDVLVAAVRSRRPDLAASFGD